MKQSTLLVCEPYPHSAQQQADDNAKPYVDKWYNRLPFLHKGHIFKCKSGKCSEATAKAGCQQ